MADKVEHKQDFARQDKYQRTLGQKGLINVRVIIPRRSQPMLREWAEKERAVLKEEMLEADELADGEEIPCIDDTDEEKEEEAKQSAV